MLFVYSNRDGFTSPAKIFHHKKSLPLPPKMHFNNGITLILGEAKMKAGKEEKE
jgi:hypothetical protein